MSCGSAEPCFSPCSHPSTSGIRPMPLSAGATIMPGFALLMRGADARQVLETCYDRSKKDQPELVDAYLATGELALEKHDFALAAEAFQTASKITPDDPAVHYGLARAYAGSDPQRQKKALARALELSAKDGSIVLSAGSMFVTAEVKTSWQTIQRP